MTTQEVFDNLLSSFESDTNSTIAANCAILFLGHISQSHTIGELAEFLADEYAHSKPGDDAFEFITLMLDGKFQELETMVCRYMEHEEMSQIRESLLRIAPEAVVNQMMKAITVSTSFI